MQNYYPNPGFVQAFSTVWDDVYVQYTTMPASEIISAAKKCVASALKVSVRRPLDEVVK